MRKFLILVLVLGVAGSAVAALPTISANALLHLDASSITGLSNNDVVASWATATGGLPNAYQVDVAEQPTYKTNQQNGLPAVSFNSASTNWMSFEDGGASDLFLADAYSFMIVGKLTSTTPDSYILTGAANQRLRYGGGSMYVHESGNGYSFSDTSNYHMFEWIAGEELYMDGSGTNSTAWAGPMVDLSSLGAKRYITDGVQPATVQADFDYAEVIVFDGALSAADRGAVEDYLAGKWGVVPEPATIMLLGLGGLALIRKKR